MPDFEQHWELEKFGLHKIFLSFDYLQRYCYRQFLGICLA